MTADITNNHCLNPQGGAGVQNMLHIAYDFLHTHLFFFYKNHFLTGFLSTTLFYCILSVSVLLLTDMQPFITDLTWVSHQGTQVLLG